jgi:hypothetical protein
MSVRVVGNGITVINFIFDSNNNEFILLFVYDNNSKLLLEVLINGLLKFDEYDEK